MSTTFRDEGTMPTTTYFSHCWGVFEGGGVRAAAHAGAYAAAREAGIMFGRVAGTSGGSIVAALVAAGAPPEYISEQLQDTNLSQFLSKANPRESVFTERPWNLRILRRIAFGKCKTLASVALDSGIYNSLPLQNWLEPHLRRLVAPYRAPGTSGPVTFEELLLPLHVVATDLTTSRPKVWSRESTPSDSVALAVRCSCSIPFFYQAVRNQQSVLIDGSVVSNLPSFVFTHLLDSGEERSGLSRVLVFRLIEDDAGHQSVSNLSDFSARLSGAVINGASHIQSILQPSVYDVVIPTGPIKSTDFENVGEKEKKQLLAAGRAAVREFINNERIKVRANTARPRFHGFDEKMLLLVQELQGCNKVFLAIGKSTYWLDFIFPTILSAARRGIQIVCITERSGDKKEKRRLLLLTRLGANIEYVSGGCKLPFDGFIFDPETDKTSAILSTVDGVVGTADFYAQERVRFYTRDSDPAVLEMLTERLTPLWTPKPSGVRQLPYVMCPEQDLFNLLRTVPQYAKATFRLDEVAISDNVLVLQEAVKEFKMLQVKQHIRELETHNRGLFEPLRVDLLSGPGTIVTPPVLERVGTQNLVLIEGSARFFHCLITGVKTVRAVIVDNVSAELPGKSQKRLSLLRLTSSTMPLTENYPQMNRSLFRRIEDAVHPYVPETQGNGYGKV